MLWSGLGAAALLAAIGGAWIFSLPPTAAGTAGAIETRNGIRIFSDQVATSWPAEHLLPAIGDRQPAKALDQAIDAIAARYGPRTADFVTMQLEYPRERAD